MSAPSAPASGSILIGTRYHPVMAKRIAVVGAGALGGYVGGTLAHLGHDITFIDSWPENVETIRSRGLELDGMTPEERFTVREAKTLHITELQAQAKSPFDIAMVAMKSYDTAWATALIAPYLAPSGFVVSLQNCLNEETIAGIVGWGRVVGVVASLISVDMYEAGRCACRHPWRQAHRVPRRRTARAHHRARRGAGR